MMLLIVTAGRKYKINGLLQMPCDSKGQNTFNYSHVEKSLNQKDASEAKVEASKNIKAIEALQVTVKALTDKMEAVGET